jgi:hypothetical protein
LPVAVSVSRSALLSIFGLFYGWEASKDKDKDKTKVKGQEKIKVKEQGKNTIS